jgi:hypothetical protein
MFFEKPETRAAPRGGIARSARVPGSLPTQDDAGTAGMTLKPEPACRAVPPAARVAMAVVRFLLRRRLPWPGCPGWPGGLPPLRLVLRTLRSAARPTARACARHPGAWPPWPCIFGLPWPRWRFFLPWPCPCRGLVPARGLDLGPGHDTLALPVRVAVAALGATLPLAPSPRGFLKKRLPPAPAATATTVRPLRLVTAGGV